MKVAENPFREGSKTALLYSEDWSDFTAKQIAEKLDIKDPSNVYTLIRRVEKRTGCKIKFKKAYIRRAEQ